MYTDVSAADKTKYDFILNLFIPTPAIASCQGHVIMKKNAHVRTHRPVLKSTIVVSTFVVPIIRLTCLSAICIYTYMYRYIYMYICVCIHIYIYLQKIHHTQTYVNIHIYVNTYMYICIFVYSYNTHIHICTNIHRGLLECERQKSEHIRVQEAECERQKSYSSARGRNHTQVARKKTLFHRTAGNVVLNVLSPFVASLVCIHTQHVLISWVYVWKSEKPYTDT